MDYGQQENIRLDQVWSFIVHLIPLAIGSYGFRTNLPSYKPKLFKKKKEVSIDPTTPYEVY